MNHNDLKIDIMEFINEGDFYELWELLEKNKEIFEGYESLREEYIKG